jgi:hypothetical protein
MGWGILSDNWTVTASATESGTDADRVKERYNIARWWSLGATSHGWIKVDLGSNYSVSGIRVENRRNNEYPKLYTIHYSTDDSAYFQIADGGTEAGLNYCNIVESWTPVTARYLRINREDSHGGDWTITTIYVYKSTGDISGISEGNFDTTAHLTDEALDFTYMRRSDLLYKIAENVETSNIQWETWVDNDGAVYLMESRGSDKSSVINFRYSSELADMSYNESKKARADRVKVLGKGQGHEQDIVSSTWQGSGDYELVVTEKEVENQAQANERATIIQNERGQNVITIRTKIKDTYRTGDWRVGDDVSLTEIHTGVSGSYRVKKVIRTYRPAQGEVVTIEASTARGDVVDTLKHLKKQLEEASRGDSQTDAHKADDDQEKIAPNYIHPDILIPSPQENLVLNYGFERDYDADDIPDYWTSETSNGSATILTTDSYLGQQCVQLSVTNVAGYSRLYSEYIAITPSTGYFASVYTKSELATNADVYFLVYWYKRDKTASATPSTTIIDGNGTTSWSQESSNITSPSDAYYARVYIGCNTPTSLDGGETYTLFDEVVLSRQRAAGGFMDSTEIIDTTVGGEVQITTGSFTSIRSGTCSSETSAINLALIQIQLDVGASGGGPTHVQCAVYNAGSPIHEFQAWFPNSVGYTFRYSFLYPTDYSGDAVAVWGRPIDANIYLRGDIQVQQFKTHTHS